MSLVNPYSDKPFHITATEFVQSLIVDETDLTVKREDIRYDPIHQDPDEFYIIVECPRTKQTLYLFHYRRRDNMTRFLKHIVIDMTEDWDW